MRIIHLGNIPIPLDIPGCDMARAVQHPGRWVLNHALAQKAAGMDVEVIAQAHKAPRDFDCDIEGVRVHFLRTYHPYRHFTFYALDAWRMARLVRKLAPNIVHAHGTEAAYGHAAVHTGLPFCITAQGLFFKIIPSLDRLPSLHEKILHIGEDRVWKKTKYAVAKSTFGETALRERYPFLDITRIYNAYDSQLETPVPPKAGCDIAFVGTVCPRKGFHLLVNCMPRILAACPDVRLHVVGNAVQGIGSSYEMEQMTRMKNILGERLVLHGHVVADEVFRILDGCRTIAAPSLEEMSGNQVTEGIMRGCHAIVFDQTGVAGIVRKVGNGTIVPHGDVKALAEAIIQSLTSSMDTTQIESARKNVRALMSPSVVAAKHHALYQRILSERECP